jgi:pimeloyl-ACP methyl ester carboxylesterase
VEERLTEATLVLVHGLAILRPADKMFSGVAEALTAKGFRVARTLTQGDGSVEELAERVWKQLALLDGPLVLLCHSMGGLQARTFLLHDQRARRIRAIATLGSPHRGTPLTHVMAPFQRAYRQMTPRARAEWERANGAAEVAGAERHGVRCLSAVASLTGRARHAQLLIPQALLQRMDGPNDGLVPATTQRWGEHAFEVDLDHIECASIAHARRAASSVLTAWVRLADMACATAPREQRARAIP